MSAASAEFLQEIYDSYEAVRRPAQYDFRNVAVSTGVFVGFVVFLAGSSGELTLTHHPIIRVMLYASLLAGVRAAYRWLRALPALRQQKRSQALENAIYETIANEADDDSRQPGLWARALANSNGDERAARSFYLRARAQEIRQQLNAAAKTKSASLPKSENAGWVLFWVFVATAGIRWFIWMGEVPEHPASASPVAAVVAATTPAAAPEPSRPTTRLDAAQRARLTDAEEQEWFALCRQYGPDLTDAPQSHIPTGALTQMAEWLAARRQVLSAWRSRVDPTKCSRATLDQYYRAEDQYEELVKQNTPQSGL